MSELIWRLSTQPDEDRHVITEGFLHSGNLHRCDDCSEHYGEETFHVVVGMHPAWKQREESAKEERMMGDTAFGPEVTAYMSRVAPLVDEVLLAMAEVKGYFPIEEVLSEIRSIYEEKKQNPYQRMGYQPWTMCIRGRLTKLGFELSRQQDGMLGWALPKQVHHAE